MNTSTKLKMEYLERPTMVLEFISCLLGDFIGGGSFREVFQHAEEDDLVVKVEYNNRGQNWLEYEAWQAVRYTEYAKWFAPCEGISKNGLILTQKKTQPLDSKPESKIPDLIPKFLTDVKPNNFGWIKNQLVCHDYAFVLSMFSGNGGLNKKMQTTKNKLKWI